MEARPRYIISTIIEVVLVLYGYSNRFCMFRLDFLIIIMEHT